jgi:hypothetical protein
LLLLGRNQRRYLTCFISVNDSLTAASWGDGRIDVFGLGESNQLLHRWFTNNTWNSGDWENLGGTSYGKPKALAPRNGRIEVFVKGMNSGT